MVNRLNKKKVEIRQKSDGTFRVFFGNKELQYKPIKELSNRETLDVKEKLVWETREIWHPDISHPWKKRSYERLLHKQKLKEAMV